MTTAELILDPFTGFAFMRRALAAIVILGIGSTPLGVFMTLRRMTLVGDAMSHAILPGVAVAFVAAGLAVVPMMLGGVVAGVLVALLALLVARTTKLHEDASFTLFYLLSLAVGVTLISLKGSSVDLIHMLFGNILAIDQESLGLMAVVACVTLFVLAGFYRSLVIECFDPDYARAALGRRGAGVVFFVLLVVNLMAGFQALGTLMALGLMLLPGIAARFWTRNIDAMIPLSIVYALASGIVGLLISYHAKLPAGPAVVLTAACVGLLSAMVGPRGSLLSYLRGVE